jgi:predicted transcriptional regulator
MNESTDQVLGLTAQIVSAHVSHNSVAPDALPGLIQEVYRTLLNVGQQPTMTEKPAPAVPVKQSIRQDRIVCLEDGKSFSMLKRHLMTDHKLTPQLYREKWGLPRDYPMVAPNYAQTRSTLAKKIGLGRKAGRPAKRATRRKRGWPRHQAFRDGIIRITPSIAIDEKAIAENFVRASGPGGQNVNKVATAVQLRFDPALSGLPADLQLRLRALAGRRVTQQGTVLITAQRFRTQERNRQAALDTLVGLIERAAEPPEPRIATRPTATSKRRRLQSKARRSRIKLTRGPLTDEGDTGEP